MLDRMFCLMVNITFVSSSWVSFDTILNQVAVQRKRPFIERVLSYWVLKRQSRNNVPLIRRLQANPQPPKTKHTVSPADTFQTEALLFDSVFVTEHKLVFTTGPYGDEPGTERAAKGVAPSPP